MLDASMFRHVQHLQAPVDFVLSVASAAAEQTPLRGVHIWYYRYQHGASVLSKALSHRITHICGYAEDHTEFVDHPRAWCRSIIDKLPCLTHVAFEVLHIASSLQYYGSMEEFDIGAFVLVVRAALEYEQLECVVVHVAGMLIERREEVEAAFGVVKDRRLRLWLDERPRPDWHADHLTTIDDVNHGRTLWTEAKLIGDLERTQDVTPLRNIESG
ncbi:hypothetical protein BKA62DRAFT_809278 [Auriculariales sp. MPI-PUGE-AT-0066]|nr:hypothetical protein BKA62DRAFT_809278 [Auriculariales sp. MPI-PUGE-AT-0066]